MMTQNMWNAKIPIKFTLENFEPLLLMVPRVSYLHLHLSIIRKHFVNVGFTTNISDVQIWFMSHAYRRPLHWHLPIGLLMDMEQQGRAKLPWEVVVHYENYPSSDLLPMSSFDSLQFIYMHALKQADYLWNGTSTYLMSLTKHEQQQLWDSILTFNMQKYLTVSSRLFQTSQLAPKSIPFKLYIMEADGRFQVLQELVSPIRDENTLNLVSDLLKMFTQDYNAVLIHGIRIPGETPLLWLCTRLHYLDYFLHLIACL